MQRGGCKYKETLLELAIFLPAWGAQAMAPPIWGELG